jgi:hypothetical protein
MTNFAEGGYPLIHSPNNNKLFFIKYYIINIRTKGG